MSQEPMRVMATAENRKKLKHLKHLHFLRKPSSFTHVPTGSTIYQYGPLPEGYENEFRRAIIEKDLTVKIINGYGEIL